MFLNRPAGTSIIRWGANRTTVSSNINGKKITRIRGKGKNLYRLQNETFKAFGNDVPEKIANVANITENNFQGQHSLPFWFGETSGEVARKLNSIVNLSLIDTSLSYLSSTLSKARHTTEICKDRLIEARKRKKELTFVVEMDREWDEVKKYSKLYNALDQKVVELEDSLEACIENQETIKSIKPPAITSLTHAYENLSRMEDRYTKIELIMDKVGRLHGDLCQLKKQQRNLQKTMKKFSKSRCPLCGRAF